MNHVVIQWLKATRDSFLLEVGRRWIHSITASENAQTIGKGDIHKSRSLKLSSDWRQLMQAYVSSWSRIFRLHWHDCLPQAFWRRRDVCGSKAGPMTHSSKPHNRVESSAAPVNDGRCARESLYARGERERASWFYSLHFDRESVFDQSLW